MSKKRPTQRTLEYCRKQGWLVDVVERFIKVPNHPGGGIRRDLFGIIDIIAIREGKILGIQTTSGSNHSSHLKKLICDLKEVTPTEVEDVYRRQDNLEQWLETGSQYEIWSWKKKGKNWEKRVDVLRRIEHEP